MNRLEDKVRTALRETGEEIAPHAVPPLRLRGAPRRLRLPPVTGRRWAAWLAPLAAAASVAAVIIASVAISGTFGGRQPTGTRGPLTPLPRYYVALRFAKSNACCGSGQPLLPRTRAVVVNTETGAVLATIAPPEPQDTFVGVTGAANDRTFVLGVQKYGTLSPTRFYLLRIGAAAATDSLLASIAPTPARPSLATISPTHAASATPAGSATPSTSPTPRGSASLSASPTLRGTPSPSAPPGRGSRFARLSPLPIPPDTSQMVGFALSPQGASLAVLDLTGLHVVDLATGSQRTWNRPPCFAGSLLGGANTDAMLSWAADGQHLATACGSDPQRWIGVWLLDTTARGGNLVKDSRRLVRGPIYAPNAQPPWNGVRLSGDGRTVAGVLEVPVPHRPATLGPIQELAEFSAQTGKLLRVLNRMPVWNYVDFEQVLWVSPSGHSLLVTDTKPYQGRRRAFFVLNDAGVLTGGHFTPLRGWSLDTMAAAF